MRVTVIPIVISALGTDPKVFLKRLEKMEIRGRIETLCLAVLSGLARIL